MTTVSRRRGDRHLSEVDPVMKRLVQTQGPCPLRRRPHEDPFDSLVRSIVSQMLSTKAAKTIYRRLVIVLGDDPSPGRVLKLRTDRLTSSQYVLGSF